TTEIYTLSLHDALPILDENLALAHGFDEGLRGGAEEAGFGDELEVAGVAGDRAALHVDVAGEVDLQEAVLVEGERPRRALDLAVDVNPLRLDVLRLVDRVL